MKQHLDRISLLYVESIFILTALQNKQKHKLGLNTYMKHTTLVMVTIILYSFVIIDVSCFLNQCFELRRRSVEYVLR